MNCEEGVALGMGQASTHPDLCGNVAQAVAAVTELFTSLCWFSSRGGLALRTEGDLTLIPGVLFGDTSSGICRLP